MYVAVIVLKNLKKSLAFQSITNERSFRTHVNVADVKTFNGDETFVVLTLQSRSA